MKVKAYYNDFFDFLKILTRFKPFSMRYKTKISPNGLRSLVVMLLWTHRCRLQRFYLFLLFHRTSFSSQMHLIPPLQHPTVSLVLLVLIVNTVTNSKRCRRKTSWSNSQHFRSIYMEGLTKTTKMPQSVQPVTGPRFVAGTPEYEERVLRARKLTNLLCSDKSTARSSMMIQLDLGEI